MPAAVAGEWTPFRFVDDRPAIPVQMGKLSGWATLDTAASRTLVSRAAAAAAGRTFRRSSEPFKQDWIWREPSRKALPNARAELLGVDVELGPTGELSNPATDELIRLGTPFLSLFVVQIDYPGRRLRFLLPDSVSLPDDGLLDPQRDWMTGAVVLASTINGYGDVRLAVATSQAGGVLLDRKVVERRGLGMSPVSTDGIDAEVLLGPTALSGVPVTLSDAGDARGHYTAGPTSKVVQKVIDQRIDGLVGNDVLKHFVVTLDLRRGRIHFALPEP